VSPVTLDEFARCYYPSLELRHSGSYHLTTPLPFSTSLGISRNFFIAVFALLLLVVVGGVKTCLKESIMCLLGPV
jgi:hypothetical protein